MNKVVPTFLTTTFVFILSTTPVSAVTSNIEVESNTTVVVSASPSPIIKRVQESSNTRVEVKQNIQEVRKEAREEIKKERETMQDKIQNLRQELRDNAAERHAVRIERRFNFYASQLTNISVRIQTRIDKEKAEGKNVDTAQDSLNKGKASLTFAIENGKKAVQAFKDITTEEWDAQKEAAKAAKDLADTARKGFIESRKLFIEAVVSLQKN